jgi:hypothetical protein
MKSKIYFLISLSLLWFGELSAQNNSKELAKASIKASADSSYIAVNKKAGWQFFSSYLAPIKADSVIIEMVVQHDRTIDWKQDQLIGHIKQDSMFPKTSQVISFMLMFDEYLLRVEPSGKCYLRLAKGAIPDGDPVILPIRAKYKL